MDTVQSIVVAVDFSGPSQAATARASWLAERCHASVHVVHSARLPVPVISHEFAIPGPEWETIRSAAQTQVDAIAADLKKRGLDATAEVSREIAVDAILSAATKHNADLIVMGSHGHTGLSHLMLGSVAERTLRGATVPVLVVKEEKAKAAKAIGRIVFATDFSAHAGAAAELAVGFAKALGASVEICHVQSMQTQPWMSIEPPPPSDWVEALRREASERVQEVLAEFTKAGVEARTHLIEDTPSLAIPALAEELQADLIVMGTRGHSGLRHVLLGSVAERTVRMATCSVLTAPLRSGVGS